MLPEFKESIVSLPIFWYSLYWVHHSQKPRSEHCDTDGEAHRLSLEGQKKVLVTLNGNVKIPWFFPPFFSSSPVTRLSCGGKSLTATGTHKNHKSHKNPQGLRRPPSSLVGGAAVLKCEASPYGFALFPSTLSPPLCLRQKTDSVTEVSDRTQQSRVTRALSFWPDDKKESPRNQKVLGGD